MNFFDKLLRRRSLIVAAPHVLRGVRFRDAQSNAFVYRMPAGIPGDVNRVFAATIEPNLIDTLAPPLSYGVPVELDAATGGVRPITTGDVLANLYGVLVRPFPFNPTTATGYMGSVALGTAGVPPTSGLCDVLKRGYMTVLLGGVVAATPGGIVYVRVANASAGKPIGGFEAAADGGNTIQAGTKRDTYFRGPADAGGNIEIAWNL